MTEKIKDKAGLCFLNCPNFKSLRETDISVGNGYTNDEIDDLTTKGKLRLKTLEKKANKLDEKEKNLKRKRKEQRDPSLKKIREHLKKMIKYHNEKVHEQIPSIYPMLGPANTDSDNDSDERNGPKRKGTKKELKPTQYT